MSATLPSGIMTQPNAMAAISAMLCVIIDGQSQTLARIHDGDLVPIKQEDAKMLFAPLFFTDSNGKARPAFPEWLKSPDRPWYNIVFKLDTTTLGPHEYNLFAGFAVDPEPSRARALAMPFVRHLYNIICVKDRVLFRYLMRWLAFCIQKPSVNPETAIVIVSAGEGTGKSLLRRVMGRIFGVDHTGVVSDPMVIYEDFNVFTKRWPICFIEDPAAMDKRVAARYRGYLTDARRRLNTKNVNSIYIDNIISNIMTANADMPIPYGVGSRRFAEFRPSEEQIGNFAYFKNIEDTMDAGGARQLLAMLQGIKLKDWHPRQIPALSEEVFDTQIEAANSVIRWLANSCGGNSMLGGNQGTLVVNTDAAFNAEHSSSNLYFTYVGWAKLMGEKPVSAKQLSSTLNKVLGKQCYRRNVLNGAKRDRGWFLPSAQEIELRLHAHMNPVLRSGLEQSVQALRRSQPELQATAMPSPDRHLIRRAGPKAADLIAAWPDKLIDTTIGMEALMKKAKQNTGLRVAIKALLDDARDTYPGVPENDLQQNVLAGLSGSMHDDFLLLAVNGNLQMFDAAGKDIGPVVPDPDAPTGVLPLKDGTFFDVVSSTPWTRPTANTNVIPIRCAAPQGDVAEGKS